MEKPNENGESTGGWNTGTGRPVTQEELITRKNIEDRLYWIQVALDGYSTQTASLEDTYNVVKGIVLYGDLKVKAPPTVSLSDKVDGIYTTLMDICDLFWKHMEENHGKGKEEEDSCACGERDCPDCKDEAARKRY